MMINPEDEAQAAAALCGLSSHCPDPLVVTHSTDIKGVAQGTTTTDTSSTSSSGTHGSPSHGHKWSTEEDELLVALVQKNRGKQWGVVASGIPGRTPKQCHQRYERMHDWMHLLIDLWSEG